MTEVTRTAEGFVVNAEILGVAFDLDPATVPERSRKSDITSRCEVGVEEDAGRWRLIFYHAGGRALRLTVDSDGAILSRSIFAARSPRPSVA